MSRSISPTRTILAAPVSRPASSLLASFEQEFARLQLGDDNMTSKTSHASLNPQATSFVPVTSSTAKYRWKAKATSQDVSPFPVYSWQAASPDAVLLYIREEEQANEEVSRLRGPLGFDLEWRVIFAKGARERKTSVLQICDHTRLLVIQLSAMDNFPTKLKEIVESPDVIKMGVNILGDGRKLQRDYNVVAGGLLELSHLANFVDPVQVPTKRMLSLQKIVELYTGYTLCKGPVRTSNWEADLTPEQLEYAANDAHSALTVYTKLLRLAEEKALDMQTVDNPNGMDIDYISNLVVKTVATAPAAPTASKRTKRPSKSSTTISISSKVTSQRSLWPSSSSSSLTTSTTTTTTKSTISQDGLKPKRKVLTATSVTSVDDSNYEYFLSGRSWTPKPFPQYSRPESAPPPPSEPSVTVKPLTRQLRRAYELWHFEKLEIAELCSVLRSPDNPLTKGTVINYVLGALKMDRSLVYSRERLKKLVKADAKAWERHSWWIDEQ